MLASVAPLLHSRLSTPLQPLHGRSETWHDHGASPVPRVVAVMEQNASLCVHAKQTADVETLHPRDGFEGHQSQAIRARDWGARTRQKLGHKRADKSERRNSATRGRAIFLRLASFLAGPSLLTHSSVDPRSSRTDLPYQSPLITLPWPGPPGPLPVERCVAIIRSFSASRLSSLAPSSSPGTVSPSPPPAITPPTPSAPPPSTVSVAESATPGRNAVSSSDVPPRLPWRTKSSPRRAY